jgi:hypothetical protein
MDTPRSTGGLSAMNSEEDDDGDDVIVLDDTVVCGTAEKIYIYYRNQVRIL